MINLTADERRVYQEKFVGALPNMTPGTYFIKDFFGTDPSVPRVARKFYEEVVNGVFNNVSLVSTRSEDGYIVS